jgi:peptidoglycan/xylan/chitin deacetylase (PgdA/CDA1 family)
MTRTIAILGYHKIGPWPGDWQTWYYVSDEIFASHLQILRAGGWLFLDVADFLHGLDEPDALPERSALVTFDDGYRSLLDHGLPTLRAFGCPAVLFVPTSYLGGTNAFDRDEEPEEAVCSAADLRLLRRQGVSIQSHGVTHRGFSDLGPDEIGQEISRSREVLEETVGESVELFSFPYGDGGKEEGEVTSLLRGAGYRAAFLYGGGLQPVPAANPFRLTRIAMGPDTDLGRVLRGEDVD